MWQRIKDRIQGKAPAGVKRSSRWPKVRAEHLRKSPECSICRGTKKCEVHHIKSFHEHPELELDPSNFITLCEASHTFCCHRIFGHLNNYKNTNSDIKKDAAVWSKRLRRGHNGHKS